MPLSDVCGLNRLTMIHRVQERWWVVCFGSDICCHPTAPTTRNSLGLRTPGRQGNLAGPSQFQRAW